MPKVLNRRTFLRGAGGVAVALPMLDAMMPIMTRSSAKAGTPPNRFLVAWGGISFGSDGREEDFVVPAATGAGYTTTRGLEPLDSEGVKGDVTVVSNLLCPWEDGGSMPPGGRSVPFHYNTMGPLFSGVAGLPGVRDGKPQGPTCDQIVREAIAGDTTFPLLAYRVQPAGYVGTNEIGGNSGALSWRRESDGRLTRIDPIVSPRLAYESLFTGFAPDDPEAAAAARFAIRQRSSVLDLVHGDLDKLVGEVGPNDRIRLERHFEEIRALERRLSTAMPMTGACALPAPFGDDPPVGGSIIEYEGAGMPYSTMNGYSDEDGRGDLLSDLVAMAFACDLTRVCSFMITEWKCYMNMFQLYGWQSDMHECTHGADGTNQATADAIAFHVKQFSRLVRKLRDLPDSDGSPILDRTAMALMFEGGNGYDPEGVRDPSAHSTENMVALLAGGAGGMTHGTHVRTATLHPASVFVTAMNAVGVAGLGDIRTSAI